MATDNHRISNLESFVTEHAHSVQHLQSQFKESFNNLRNSLEEMMDKKFEQMMKGIEALISARQSKAQTTSGTSGLELPMEVIFEMKIRSDSKKIKGATNVNQVNGAAHKVFDEKSTRDCLCVETYEDVIKQNFMLSNENEETFEEDFVEFGNSKDHKFEIKIDQVSGLGNHGEFSANLNGLPVASKVFDGSPERDGYIPTLKPKPPDEDLDEVTRHNIPFTTRRMLFTSLLMYTCYNPSRYSSAHALGDPSVTVEQVTPPVLSSGALFPTEERIVQLFEKNTYTVVNICDETLRSQLNVTGVVEVPEGNGSEFVWDEQGHIVTNYHVIGNPFGFDHTLTVGVISGLNHDISGQTGVTIGGGIQTDAAINPGNSGGLLLNSKGNLIGINTATFTQTGTSTGVGFAIPSATVIKIVPQLIQFGKVVRAGLNVDVAPDFVANQLIVRNGAVVISLSGRVLKPNWCLMTCCFPDIPLDGRFIRRCKQGCFQFLILKPMLVAVTLILYAKGKYHDGDFSARQSYLYLTIIYTFSYTMALYALALFYVACKELLQPFNPVPKFIIIKPAVFLTYWQGVMFFLAAKSGFIKDAKETIEFQNFIICVEMLIAAVGHLYAFPHKEYVGVNIGISCGFSGSLAHALKLNYFYHDTVHQFTPTYHDYVLYNNSEGDESSRKYRARTFVPTGPEMDTVRRNKYMFGNKINVENLSQRLAELVELLSCNTTSIVKDVYAVTTRLYDKHYKAAEYGMLLYEYRKETTVYIIDNEASTTIGKLFAGVTYNIEWAKAVLTHIIMDKTFQQDKVWLLQLGIAGQGPHDFYAFFLGVHKCCLRHMDIWGNTNHLCILVGTTVDALNHVFATELGVRIVEVRTNGTCALLRFDGKTQVTVEYQYDSVVMISISVHIILISTQPDESIINDEIVAWSLVLDLDEIGDLSFLSEAQYTSIVGICCLHIFSFLFVINPTLVGKGVFEEQGM